MSPRNAFSLAIKGGLNAVCAEAKCVKAAIFFSGVEEEDSEEDLLRREPIVSFEI